MTNLLEHDDPQVQALAAARLGVKSTLEEKRSQRLLAIADLDWPRTWGEKKARLHADPFTVCWRPYNASKRRLEN